MQASKREVTLPRTRVTVVEMEGNKKIQDMR